MGSVWVGGSEGNQQQGGKVEGEKGREGESERERNARWREREGSRHPLTYWSSVLRDDNRSGEPVRRVRRWFRNR